MAQVKEEPLMLTVYKGFDFIGCVIAGKECCFSAEVYENSETYRWYVDPLLYEEEK